MIRMTRKGVIVMTPPSVAKIMVVEACQGSDSVCLASGKLGEHYSPKILAKSRTDANSEAFLVVYVFL